MFGTLFQHTILSSHTPELALEALSLTVLGDEQRLVFLNEPAEAASSFTCLSNAQGLLQDRLHQLRRGILVGSVLQANAVILVVTVRGYDIGWVV